MIDSGVSRLFFVPAWFGCARNIFDGMELTLKQKPSIIRFLSDVRRLLCDAQLVLLPASIFFKP